MTTPLQDIRNGILKMDWNLVIAGYFALTGENLSDKSEKPPKAKSNRSQKTKAKPKAGTKVFKKEAKSKEKQGTNRASDISYEKFKVESKKEPEQTSGKRYAQVIPYEPPKLNKFDNMPERKQEKKHTKTDKILINKLIEDGHTHDRREPGISATTTRAVRCLHCSDTFNAYITDIRTVISDTDEQSEEVAVCPTCIRRARPRG